MLQMTTENMNKQLLHPSSVVSHYSTITPKIGDVYFLIHPLVTKSHKPGKNKRGEEDRGAM